MVRKLGRELRVGDWVAVWWRPYLDVITHLEPYDGKLGHAWPNGAQIATFEVNKTGSTIGNDEPFSVVRSSK